MLWHINYQKGFRKILIIGFTLQCLERQEIVVIQTGCYDSMIHVDLFPHDCVTGQKKTYFFNVIQVEVNEILRLLWRSTLHVHLDLSPCKVAQDIITNQSLLMRPRDMVHQPGEDFIELWE